LKKNENFDTPNTKKRVLVAPLDWGLGHATRCIPIIFKLIQQNCEVIVAAEGAGKALLQQEFPDLAFIELKGYRVQYSRNRSRMPLRLLLQFPKIISRIYAEKRWLKKVVAQYKIDAVISDNRLGLRYKKIPCVYITHQLQIKTSGRFTERIAQKIHYHFINKFNSCWVPDAAGEINLAGELSHPAVLPKTQVTYLGPLSRFEKKEHELKYDLCVVLSGPEPQRTVFENLVLRDLKDFKGHAFLLRGLPGKEPAIEINSGHLEIKNHLPATELNQVLMQSKMIISRSGYTTIMDLARLQKKAVLVPTPGQTEQEYLANYLQQRHLFYTAHQQDFSVPGVLENAAAFPFSEPFIAWGDHEKVIEHFVHHVIKKDQ
jgi:uncharacterized protein (TIGR00661 family)